MNTVSRAAILPLLLATAASAQQRDTFAGFAPSIVTGDIDFFIDGNVRAVEGADIDGDGQDDIVVLGSFGAVGYYRGQETGVFDTILPIALEDGSGESIALFDYEGDGDIDVMRSGDLDNGEVRLFLNDGSGVFNLQSAIINLGNGISINGLAAQDFDNDGDPDTYILTSTGGTVIRNTGAPLASSPVIVNAFNNLSALTMAVTDLNGDGRSDAVIGGGSGGELIVALSNGNELVEVDRVPIGFGLQDITSIDIDDDGDRDIVLVTNGNGNERVQVITNDGSGNLALAYSLPNLVDPYLCDAGDLDADGDVDIVVKDGPTGADPIHVFINNGLGAFTQQDTTWNTSSFSNRLTLIDVLPSTGLDLVTGVGSTSTFIHVRPNLAPDTVPGAFELVAPADNADGLPLPQAVSAWGGRVTPVLEWERAAGLAVEYRVRISESPSLSAPLFDQTIDDARVADISGVALQPATTYYWPAVAINAQGTTQPVGGVRSFRTAGEGSDCPSDLDGSGTIDLADLLAILSDFGSACP